MQTKTNAPIPLQSKDQRIFQLAQAYLLGLTIPGVDAPLLNKYMQLPTLQPQASTLSGIYRRLLESAQNANMKASVIGGSLGGFHKLGKVLDDFNPTFALTAYGDDWSLLLDIIERDLQPNGQIRRTPRSIWPNYGQTVLAAAQFMTQFQDAADFYQWADAFDRDSRARLALPMILMSEIHGIGFALGCDFLKELGYLNFGKPDVHLREIFVALDLCAANATDYQLLKAIIRIAEHVQETPYAVDKLFWLIGSGFFYEDPQIGTNGKIGRQKKAFVLHVQNELSAS